MSFKFRPLTTAAAAVCIAVALAGCGNKQSAADEGACDAG